MNYKRVWFSAMFMMTLFQGLIAQTSIVAIVYGKKFSDIPMDTDTISHPEVKIRMDDLNRRLLENIVDCEYTLVISKNESVFKAIEKMDAMNETGYKIALGAVKGGGIYYINLEEDLTIEQKVILPDGELYNITQKLSDIPWSLQNETKKIGKYTCYKATTTYQRQILKEKRKYFIEAWYVPELPVKHGPVGYGNLPGLILELTIGNVTFFMKDIKLNVGKRTKIIRPKAKVVTQQEFDDTEAKLAEDFFGEQF